MTQREAIHFTGISRWDLQRDSMCFEVLVAGKKVRCYVTEEALENRFDAKHSTPEQAFLNHQAEIEAIAERLICNGCINPRGELFIMSMDITSSL